MREALIVDAARTAIGKAYSGELREARSDDMAAECVRQMLARQPALDPAEVEQCVVGCAFPEGPQGLNLARNVGLLALGNAASGLTLTRYCASGLDALGVAAEHVQAGNADVVVAAGVESVSLVLRGLNPKQLFNPTLATEVPNLYFRMACENRETPFWKRAGRSMCEVAEFIAEREGISRSEQDRYACHSQLRAVAARDAGVFEADIIPLAVENTEFSDSGDAVRRRVVVDRDECIRPETTGQVLAQLEPSVRSGGTVTAGNSCPVADGAACALVVSNARAEELGLEPLGIMRGYVTSACAPPDLARGSVLAVRKLLKRHGLSVADIDLFEINEAFAAQTVFCIRALELDEQRVNVSGGAISLGHPYGMTGCRLVGQLLRALKRQGGRLGVVSICVGGGIGVAALLEAC